MEEKEYINSQEALDLAEEKGISITLMTLHSWAKKYNFGHQPAGTNSIWAFNRLKFIDFLEGKCQEK